MIFNFLILKKLCKAIKLWVLALYWQGFARLCNIIACSQFVKHNILIWPKGSNINCFYSRSLQSCWSGATYYQLPRENIRHDESTNIFDFIKIFSVKLNKPLKCSFTKILFNICWNAEMENRHPGSLNLKKITKIAKMYNVHRY